MSHCRTDGIHGQKATLVIGYLGERLELVPEKEFESEFTPENLTGLQAADTALHRKNWFDCIRSGKQSNANIDLALRVQTVLSLAEMSYRLKVSCLFDPKTRKVSDGTGREIALLTYQV